MESQQLATISEPRSADTEKQRRNLLRQWLVRFALNAGQPLDADAQSVYVTLWLEGFADLSDALLEAAFRKTLATCKFWPIKIADVREHIDVAAGSCFEDEWQALLDYVQQWVYHDLPARGPRLPADIDHAARAAGGVRYLESCSKHDLIFAKQRFIEDLTRQRKTGDIAGFLPGSELRGLLEDAAPRFALLETSEGNPARRVEHSESMPRPPMREVERAAKSHGHDSRRRSQLRNPRRRSEET